MELKNLVHFSKERSKVLAKGSRHHLFVYVLGDDRLIKVDLKVQCERSALVVD